MAYEDILFEVEGGIDTITFNRPEVLNALKMGTLAEVGEAWALSPKWVKP